MQFAKVWRLLGFLLVLVLAGCTYTAPTELVEIGSAVAAAPSECADGIGHGNPADAYCLAMGYRLEAALTADGGEYSLCAFPDGESCDAWAFFQGECGEAHSYCAKQGLGQVVKKGGGQFSAVYAVCVDKNFRRVWSCDYSSRERISPGKRTHSRSTSSSNTSSALAARTIARVL